MTTFKNLLKSGIEYFPPSIDSEIKLSLHTDLQQICLNFVRGLRVNVLNLLEQWNTDEFDWHNKFQISLFEKEVASCQLRLVFRSRLHTSTIGEDIQATCARSLWGFKRASALSINRLWNIRGVRPQPHFLMNDTCHGGLSPVLQLTSTSRSNYLQLLHNFSTPLKSDLNPTKCTPNSATSVCEHYLSLWLVCLEGTVNVLWRYN